MKTTVELPDALLEQARRAAQGEGATLRALVIEGIQRSLRREAGIMKLQPDSPYGNS